VASILGVDDPSEAALDLAVSDLRLKAAKLPVDHFRRTLKSDSEKTDRLDSIKVFIFLQ
jgi:hypothetical protein